MPRRRDSKRQRNGLQNAQETFGVPIPNAQPQGKSVMSVSARGHNATIETIPVPARQTTVAPASNVTADAQTNQEILISPRVLDQQAFAQFSASLSALIEEAREARLALAEVSQQQRLQQTETARSAQQLQERLHLSARMLKAMQGQAAALQTATDTASKACDQYDVLEQRLSVRIDELIAAAETRIDTAVDAAIARINISAREKETLLHEVDQRFDQLMPRAEQLGQVVESAEVNIAALAHRSAGSAQRAVQATESLGDCIERAQAMGTDLQARIDCAEAFASVIQEANTISKRWQQTIEHIEKMPVASTPSIQPKIDLATRVSQQSEPKPQSQSVNSMVEDLRKSIARDMQRLSTAVSAIASRVDKIQSQPAHQGSALSNAATDRPHITSLPTPNCAVQSQPAAANDSESR